jgi:exosome complex RNA-binding protein Csl4
VWIDRTDKRDLAKVRTKTRNTTKTSASSVLEEISKPAESGPVISVSSVNGLEINVSPSPIAAKLISVSAAGGSRESVRSLGSR